LPARNEPTPLERCSIIMEPLLDVKPIFWSVVHGQ
jgi:hypothetical protein